MRSFTTNICSLYLLLSVAKNSVVPAQAATYSLIEQHAGQSFFDGWEFVGGYDNTTNGDVVWSSSSELAYVNSNGQAIIKVDNTTTVPYNEKRSSVKLLSSNWYKPGTVFVLDAAHVPVGCSVWPAWWTQGQNWPEGGEIDIFEPVNLQPTNQYALHTTAGCIATPDPAFTVTGTVGATDCDQEKNFGSGCTVTGGEAGYALNALGGGVWVMAFELTGVTIWYHPRDGIPGSLTAGAQSIDTSTLGNPVASYSSSTCDINKFFTSQQMTLDITLCGDYAGSPAILGATCPALQGDKTCYTTYVLDSASYNDAYFEINYLNIFGTADSIDTALSTGQSNVAQSSSSSVSVGSAPQTTMGTPTSSARVTGTTTAVGGLIGSASQLVGAGSSWVAAFAMGCVASGIVAFAV